MYSASLGKTDGFAHPRANGCRAAGLQVIGERHRAQDPEDGHHDHQLHEGEARAAGLTAATIREVQKQTRLEGGSATRLSEGHLRSWQRWSLGL